MGDILLVRFKTGEPFAGVCMNIRRRGVDTGILLRAQLTRVGTEMWVKVFSPTVVGIEVVQRVEKRVRRARAYYFRYVDAIVALLIFEGGGVIDFCALMLRYVSEVDEEGALLRIKRFHPDFVSALPAS